MSLRKQSSSKINLTGAFSSNDDECQHLERSSNHYRENTRDSQRDNFAVVDDRHSSPSAWIYKGGRTLQDFCRPFMGGTGQVKHLKGADSMKPTQDESVASWRKMAAQSILSRENNADCGSNRAFDSRNSYDDPPHPMFRVDSIQEGGSSKKVSHNCNQSLMIDEPRIVAPNVSKLSPRSVVEVRLQSANECVAILCSVDVLKMRSVFFYEVLNAQEDNRSNNSREQNDIWREPLVIPESSPFEAAAFLESLHEGRSLFKGDWVYSWARLR